MNKTSIKNYAIWARNELISRVTQKAFEYGVEKDNILPYDAESINGRLLSDDEKKKRQILINEVKRKGYDQVIEEVAYTWFNRFIALRFMEVNNYLPDKVRLFTNENNEFKPQIIDEALHIELSGLDKNKIIALKEANNNEELYKELLLATCNDMSRYLPGMFKPISDYMTLLFPSNLLREESVLGRLISDIDEDSWTDQVQIIGWLYQYYNTEPKDKVYARKSGTKIKKEEIPAVTQLFTPDWIVRYMTENSLGRLWLDGHPDTDIKSNWKYYLEEAEQEESVQIELNKIKAEHAKLKPEDIKFLDPCMGSGHILVYAFDVFMQIYVSEGWTEREAAKSILQNNIYGLDIDERAYQLSYFALMMKARQYNRRILSEGIIPNVMAIEESNAFNNELLRRFGNLQPLAERVVNIFIDAKEYGSILNVELSKEELDSLEEKLNEIDKMSDYGNLLDQLESEQLYRDFYPFLKQARIMSQKYECVVTNPPYMGNMPTKMTAYVNEHYSSEKYDLYAVFVKKSFDFSKIGGYDALITQQAWLFLSSFEKFRLNLLNRTLINLIQLGPRAFDEISGEVVQTVAFVFENNKCSDYLGIYKDLVKARSQDEKERMFFLSDNIYTTQHLFSQIPGNTYAYWIPKKAIDLFNENRITDSAVIKSGIVTGDNNKFLRLWHEIPIDKIGFHHVKFNNNEIRWVPMHKGGGYRKHYGLHEYVMNLHDIWDPSKTNNSVRRGDPNYYFKQGLTWSTLANDLSVRLSPEGFVFDTKGSMCFPLDNSKIHYFEGFLNSKVASYYMSFLSPTLDFNQGAMEKIPFVKQTNYEPVINSLSTQCVTLCKNDWDSFETSWDFKCHPLLRGNNTIKESYSAWERKCTDRFEQLKANEEKLNRIFIDIYGLQDVLTAEVEDSEITVRKADLQREIKSLLSYAVGCMFGRYSLDVEGLAYAGGEWDDSTDRNLRMIDLLMEEKINNDEYEAKRQENILKLERLKEEEENLKNAYKRQEDSFRSIDDFKKVLSGSECLESFSPEIFDLLVETILVGGYTNGEPDPYLITFVFKGGSQRSIDGSGFKEDRRRKKALHPVWNSEGVELHIDNKEEAREL